MAEKIYRTEKGPIHYRIGSADGEGPCLVFLPGLTADHRLFEKQTDFFEDKYRLFVWDAPGHGYRMLAEAIEADLPYEIKCPARREYHPARYDVFGTE